MVDRLERRGLLTRERDSKDRRGVRVSLPPAGQQLYEEASQAHRFSILERLSVLTDAERTALKGLLEMLKASLESGLAKSSSGC